MRRRPTDALRVVVAAVLVVPLAYHAGHLTLTEQRVVEFFDSIPHGARTLFLVLYQLAALWAVGLLVVTVLLLRRWRLARDLVVAAGLAWVVGRLLAYFTNQTDLWDAIRVTFDLGNVPRFPMVRVAVATAVVLVASPHLTRPTRRIGQGIVVLLALTGLYLGRGAPTDLLAALVLGWGVAALVQFAFGTPVGRPTVAQVERALASLGVAITGVRLADEQPVGRALFLGEAARGPVRIVALGRDEADAQWLARAWRYLAYRDAAPTLLATRRSQVEYEAYLALLARDAGVDTPRVVVAGEVGALALLVIEQAPGIELYDLEPDAVTDDDARRRVARSGAAPRGARRPRQARRSPSRGRRRARADRELRLRDEQRAVPPDRGRRGPGARRDVREGRARARGRRRGARGRGGGGDRGDAGAAARCAVGLDPRRARRAVAARRPARRAARRVRPRHRERGARAAPPLPGAPPQPRHGRGRAARGRASCSVGWAIPRCSGPPSATPTGGSSSWRSCSASAPTSPSASPSSATCPSGCRSGRASSCNRRCRSPTSRCRWPPTPRCRSASSRRTASTSAPRSRPAACSARSPRSSCRSGCSSSRCGSRPTRSTSAASTPRRSWWWC